MHFFLCLFGGFLDKHSHVRRRNARSSGDEEGSAVRNGRAYCYGKAVNRVAPDESTKLRVRSDFFCTNATSGIMRRRRLMCESRVCPHPKGFADSKRGKHVRKGDMCLEEFALSQYHVLKTRRIIFYEQTET